MAVNKVILLGYVGKEPDFIKFDSGKSKVRFSLATTERGYKTKSGVEVPERTEWHNVEAWGSLADVIQRFVHKGDQLYLEGSLRTNKYTDEKTGVEKYSTSVVLNTIEFLGSKKQGAENNTPAEKVQADTDDLPFKK